jgi:uncharacterized protein (TIGR03086 family)
VVLACRSPDQLGLIILSGIVVAPYPVKDWRFEGDLLGNDVSTWPGSLVSSIQEAHAAVARPGALGRNVHLSFGDVSGQQYVTQLTADPAIHGWDLARATGQDDTLDHGAVALLLPWTEANAGLLAGSGMFGYESTRPVPRMTSTCSACSAGGPEGGI